MARASDEEPVRLVYSAPASCPAQTVFTAQIRARTQRFREAGEEEPARRFTAVITLSGATNTGKLLIRELDGSETSREVDGDTCAEIVSALALVTAFAIDPSAAAAPPPPPPRPVSQPPHPELAPPPVSERPPEPQHVPSQRWRFSAGAGAAFGEGISPRLLFLTPVFVDAARGSREAGAPSFRLGFARGQSGSIDVAGEAASFTWTAGFLDACPLRSTGFEALRFSLCARLEAGTLAARGIGTTPRYDALRGWFALGVLPRLEWALLGPLFVEAEAGLRFPIIRDRFFFEPDTTVYRPPAASFLAGAAAGVHFP